MAKLRRKRYRLQLMGGPPRHPYIALPSGWVRAMGLEKGDEVLAYYALDKPYVLIALPGAKPVDEVLLVERDDRA